MDKNEILEKSRLENENGDERQLNGIKNAGNISVIVCSIFCCIFAFVRLFILDESADDLMCILFSMNATNGIVQYIYLKKKMHLVSAIGNIVVVIMYLSTYIIDLIG